MVRVTIYAPFHMLYGRERFYMDRHTIIFTTDDRQRQLGELLIGEKISCTWEDYENKYGKCKKVQRVFVLPTPVNKLDKNNEIVEKLKLELINEKAQIQVFGGAITKPWQQFLEEKEITYVDFMTLDDVIEGNAQITAEAVLAEALQMSLYSLAEQTVLVTGYGRCARPIADKLARIGATVIVAARSKCAKEEATMKGYKVCDISQIAQMAPCCEMFINTVPAMIFTSDIIQKMTKDARILDIASKPGGTDFEAAERYEIKAKLALGLPGIYSTRSSAKLLEKAMLRYAPLQQQERGEQSWIFQIII